METFFQQRGPVPKATNVTIADSDGRNLHISGPFYDMKDVPVLGQECPTRVILVRHPVDPNYIDGYKIGLLAQELGLDAMLIWRHVNASHMAPVCPVPQPTPCYNAKNPP